MRILILFFWMLCFFGCNEPMKFIHYFFKIGSGWWEFLCSDHMIMVYAAITWTAIVVSVIMLIGTILKRIKNGIQIR